MSSGTCRTPASRGNRDRPVVDDERWPSLATAPRSPLRGLVATVLVRRMLARLPLRVETAGEPTRNGRAASDGGDRSAPTLRIDRPKEFFRRVGADGLIGFGESYMAGDWGSDDLVGLLTVLARRVGTLVPAPLRRLRAVWEHRRPAESRNTPQGARNNIRHHYDLSNAFFALFLDETMSYSGALFDSVPDAPDVPDTARSHSRLVTAQRRKVDRLLDKAAVSAGDSVLEIGTGWGELALRAAARGALVRTVTLSEEQRHAAERRVAAAGYADRVTVELCDYRSVTTSTPFDAILSVEMIEAVGQEYWTDYVRTLDRLLAPHGRIALQAITMPHDRMMASSSAHTWIGKYIFPGGQIPSVQALEERLAHHTGLRIVESTGAAGHYAETLRLWRERFRARAADVDLLGFDETFRRMWTFYLAYAEAGFRARYLDVRQMVITRDTGGTTPRGGRS